MNFNCDTDVNESKFEDIRKYQTIDTPDVVYQLLGDMIVLDHAVQLLLVCGNRIRGACRDVHDIGRKHLAGELDRAGGRRDGEFRTSLADVA